MIPNPPAAPETPPPHWVAILQIDQEEDRLLRRWGKRVTPRSRREFVDVFYRHLLSHDEPKRILSEPGRMERLRATLERYVGQLLEAPIDEAYISERRRIGLAHRRIGLLPRWYLGGYSIFLSYWLPRASKGAGGEARVRAFQKRVLLDSILAMESYVSARVEGLEQEKKTLDREVRERGRRLAESERQYEQLVENAPIMILQMNEESRFSAANQTGLLRLGYSEEEIQRMEIGGIVPPAYLRGVTEHMEKAAASGSARIESFLRAKSGEEFPVEIHTMAIFSGDGRSPRLRSFVRDLSERERLERELVKWERLASVGSMAAKVAHEIRNPLLALSLNAELLGDELGALPAEGRQEGERLLETIMSQVDRLNAIIEEYLAFARLPRLSLQEVSLGEVFYRIDQLLAQELTTRGIRLVVSLDENLPPVTGDARQLEQVFLNLLRNAEDAMPGGGEIRVSARAEPDGAHIVIADTGQGIPPESIEKIFDPFFTTKDTGTGLGLAFVQQVLDEHRAKIQCQSRPGEGTVFTIRFPSNASAAAVGAEDRRVSP